MLQKCLLEAYYENINWDIYLSNIQPHINAYALRVPLVYQYQGLNGMEEDTFTEFNLKNSIVKNSVNKSNISIFNNYK